jgi:HEAT repeat protein
MDDRLRLCRSANLVVRVRAAALLLADAHVPLNVLLEILDELHNNGLGAATERVLLRRPDVELVDEMIRRVRSGAPFVREVACSVLGRLGDRRATASLLSALDDPSPLVRRAAGYALAQLNDPASATALLNRYHHAGDDINVRMAIECALRALGADYRS